MTVNRLLFCCVICFFFVVVVVLACSVYEQVWKYDGFVPVFRAVMQCGVPDTKWAETPSDYETSITPFRAAGDGARKTGSQAEWR